MSTNVQDTVEIPPGSRFIYLDLVNRTPPQNILNIL